MVQCHVRPVCKSGRIPGWRAYVAFQRCAGRSDGGDGSEVLAEDRATGRAYCSNDCREAAGTAGRGAYSHSLSAPEMDAGLGTAYAGSVRVARGSGRHKRGFQAYGGRGGRGHGCLSMCAGHGACLCAGALAGRGLPRRCHCAHAVGHTAGYA